MFTKAALSAVKSLFDDMNLAESTAGLIISKTSVKLPI